MLTDALIAFYARVFRAIGTELGFFLTMCYIIGVLTLFGL